MSATVQSMITSTFCIIIELADVCIHCMHVAFRLTAHVYV